jgi:hypothetical protein
MNETSYLLPANTLLEEEQNSDYDARRFYSVRLGETMHRKYQIVSKLGFGIGSTVWLAQDTNRFVNCPFR